MAETWAEELQKLEEGLQQAHKRGVFKRFDSYIDVIEDVKNARAQENQTQAAPREA